jgi:hypothetical protein
VVAVVAYPLDGLAALLPLVTSRLDFWNDNPNRTPWFSEIG